MGSREVQHTCLHASSASCVLFKMTCSRAGPSSYICCHTAVAACPVHAREVDGSSVISGWTPLVVLGNKNSVLSQISGALISQESLHSPFIPAECGIIDDSKTDSLSHHAWSNAEMNWRLALRCSEPHIHVQDSRLGI